MESKRIGQLDCEQYKSDCGKCPGFVYVDLKVDDQWLGSANICVPALMKQVKSEHD